MARENTQSGPVILLIEPDQAIRDMLCSYLELKGYVVLAAAGTMEARLAAAPFDGPIELLIGDWHTCITPRADGTRQLLDRYRAMKVLLLAEGASRTSEWISLGELQVPLLAKPFALDELDCCVSRILSEGL